MNLKCRSKPSAAVLLILAFGSQAASAATAFVDFENNPNLAQGPSIFVAVPAAQTIVTEPATFTGGVVLGLATFFPAISFASSPNVYGTADFGNNLSRTLTIDISPSFLTTEVSFALFNGETFAQSYTVNTYNGSSLVASQNLANIAANFNSGYGLVDLVSTSGITKVTIDADGTPAVWDFLIDDVAFNQSLTSVITTPLPPIYQPSVDPVVVQIDNLDTYVVDSSDGHKQKRKGKGLHSVQVDFGEDLSNIQSQVLLVDPVITTPVPEPETWALLLAGLCGLRTVADRRRKKAIAAA